MIGRVDWTTYFLGLSKYVASRSTCATKQVGAVIIDPKTNGILSTGYNGAPRGLSHCGPACANRKIGENSKACGAVHAEANAIYFAARRGIRIEDSILYCTISPCLTCARAIVQSGIVEVIVAAKAPYEPAIDLLKKAGVKLKIISGISLPKFSMRKTDE